MPDQPAAAAVVTPAPPARQVTLRFLAEPTDVNFGGKVHGGTVMKWIDQAGYTAATGWCGQYCVTVYVGGIRFHRPIRIGELVEVTARVILTGTTSMHLTVDVAAGDPKTRALERSTHCIIIFVAVDTDGRPAPVPAWVPETPADLGLADYARRLMALREGIEQEMSRFL